ncbi:hypothetical protein ANTRET_LOCUS1338 [Anthophora retusa]
MTTHSFSYTIVPLISTPIADMIKVVDHIQHDALCRNFELHLADCLGAYGFIKGQTECTVYMEDLMECVHEEKRLHRASIMQGENMRQVKNGERQYQEIPAVFHF